MKLKNDFNKIIKYRKEHKMRSTKMICALFLTLLFLNQGESQVTQEWAARYNGTPGNAQDYGYSVAVDGSGNVYTTGYSTGIGTGTFDYATTKCNSSGVQLWVSRYNGPGNGTDYSYSIAVDGSGYVYVTGASIGAGTDYDYATIKYDASGVELWVARYHGPGGGQDFGRSVKVDVSGNVYVTGGSPGTGSFIDYTTIKYNSFGVQLWVSRYNGPQNGYDESYSLVLDDSGNVYVTGESYGGTTNEDYATVKYNSSGDQQWSVRYNGTGNLNDIASSISVDPSGFVSVTGRSDGTGTNADYATVHYSPAGVQQWALRYNGFPNGADYANAIATDASGNIYVTGQSKGPTIFSEYATIKYNSAGVQQWVSRYNGPGSGNDIARSMALDGYGNVYVTGNSRGSVGFDDYATIKYNSAGDSQWVARYDGPGHNTEECRSIAVDGSGNVYVAGFSYGGSGPQYDYATIKYSQQGVSLTINLTSFIEGFYNSVSNNMISDSVRVYLKNISSPYNTIDSSKGKLSSSGTGAFLFSNAVNGTNYYLIIKHRNSIETWSSAGVAFSAGILSYDFTNALNKAYGNNMKQADASPIRFSFYSGDINQDGTVDASDISLVDNAASISQSGYVNTDVTGDDFVDAGDVSIVDNNAFNSVSIVRP